MFYAAVMKCLELLLAIARRQWNVFTHFQSHIHADLSFVMHILAERSVRCTPSRSPRIYLGGSFIQSSMCGVKRSTLSHDQCYELPTETPILVQKVICNCHNHPTNTTNQSSPCHSPPSPPPAPEHTPYLRIRNITNLPDRHKHILIQLSTERSTTQQVQTPPFNTRKN